MPDERPMPDEQEPPHSVSPDGTGRVFRSEPAPGASLLFGDATRSVTRGEIDALEASGCRADDWSDLRVAPGFDVRYIERVRFRGRVVIGATGWPAERGPGLTIPSGLYDATVSRSEIGDGALIDRVGLIHGVVVDDGAHVTSTSEFVHDPGDTFGNGQVLRLVCHPGGRPVRIRAEMAFEQAVAAASNPPPGEVGMEEAPDWSSEYSYVGPAARISSCGRIDSCWIGGSAVVRNASSLERTTLLSDADRPSLVLDGCDVTDSLVQRGCRISGSAFVHRSLVCEGTVVERHGIVQESIIGPDSVIAEGEISKSLVGPLTGFHHQSLLVSAFWPEGRGNVGYGANVGSNHTGKAPDQEIRPGEGAFFGLGVNIKFPTDFSRAPYVLVASGTDTLPQRVTMPFALIAVPSRPIPGLSTAIQEIRPGWMLSENPYALLRNELKFASRGRSIRGRTPTAIFRPEIVDEVARALAELESISGRAWYTDHDLQGIGKNVLTEEARVEAVAAYRTCLRRYGLRAAFARLRAGEPLAWSPTPATGGWGHARRFLETPVGEREPAVLVRLHLAEVVSWARSVEACKRRDDDRGLRILDDYAAVHPQAGTDEVVVRAHEIADETRSEAAQLLAAWGLG